jgi:flagellar motility protein MotE (MotC chaperone)
MRGEKGRIPVSFFLIALPLSFFAMLVAVYVGLYGWNPPFELRLKTEIGPGTLVSDEEMLQRKAALYDSLKALGQRIEDFVRKQEEIQRQVSAWQDSLKTLEKIKRDLEKQLAELQSELARYQAQIDAAKQQRMNRLTKILQSLTPEQLDSLYVASLDDRTLMDIIAMAKAQQAAAVLSKVDPRRAARLTAKYINP